MGAGGGVQAPHRPANTPEGGRVTREPRHPSRRGDAGGSRIGSLYRDTTPEMAARVIDAIEKRLLVALQHGGGSHRERPEPISAQGVLDDRFQGASMVVGDQGPGDRLAGVVVVPD